MKKYLFGIAALALAVGFSAFTKPAKINSAFGNAKTFVFIGDPLLMAQVEEETDYWREITTANPVCEFEATSPDDVACRITVDELYYHDSDPGAPVELRLNEADPDGAGANDLQFVITGTSGLVNGTDVYKVVQSVTADNTLNSFDNADKTLP